VHQVGNQYIINLLCTVRKTLNNNDIYRIGIIWWFSLMFLTWSIYTLNFSARTELLVGCQTTALVKTKSLPNTESCNFFSLCKL